MIRCYECAWNKPVEGQTPNGHCELMDEMTYPNEGCTVGCLKDDTPQHPATELEEQFRRING